MGVRRRDLVPDREDLVEYPCVGDTGAVGDHLRGEEVVRAAEAVFARSEQILKSAHGVSDVDRLGRLSQGVEGDAGDGRGEFDVEAVHGAPGCALPWLSVLSGPTVGRGLMRVQEWLILHRIRGFVKGCRQNRQFDPRAFLGIKNPGCTGGGGGSAFLLGRWIGERVELSLGDHEGALEMIRAGFGECEPLLCFVEMRVHGEELDPLRLG